MSSPAYDQTWAMVNVDAHTIKAGINRQEYQERDGTSCGF
jgi:hypothetical protein